MRYRQRQKSAEEKIRNAFLRRCRESDRKAKRRAESYGVKCENVSRDEVRKLHGDNCHLCGRFVSVHDASLDHVIPLIDGGEHTYENIRLAHRVCNSKKGDRLVSELNLSEFLL